MQLIGSSTSTATPTGEFTEGSAAGGVPATLLKATWLNCIQRELVAVVQAAGIQLSSVDDTQLLKALRTFLKDYVPTSGGAVAGSIILSNGTEDAPEFGWKTPSGTVNVDVLNSQFRISASYGSTFSTALLLDIPGKTAAIFGSNIWHAGNFKPSDKLNADANAVSASRLVTPRTISVTGAAAGSATFDGTSNATINIALADIGVVAGTYTKVTINGKGQVIGSSVLVPADIPSLDYSKITTGRPTTLAEAGITDALGKDSNAVSASKLATPRTISVTGAAAGSATFDGTSNATINIALADIGVVAGTYTKVTINGKGQVIGSSVLVPADIPSLDYSKITTGRPTTLAGAGITDALGISAKATQADIESGASANKYIDPAGAFAATQDVFCGMIFYHASSAPPPGSVKANGAAVSRVLYAKLFARIGTYYGAGDGVTTFNLPDVRGEFGRFWDDARGIDFGRVFGSWQAGALESHTHTLAGSVNFTYVANPDSNMKPFRDGGSTYQTGWTGGNETRPRNLAFLGCIKY